MLWYETALSQFDKVALFASFASIHYHGTFTQDTMNYTKYITIMNHERDAGKNRHATYFKENSC